MNTDIKEEKRKLREYIWKLLETRNIARFPRPVYGRIPNFEGAEKAAENLFKTNIWKRARVVKVNPDSPQKPIRYRALVEGKILIVATPRLRQGFVLLEPNEVPVNNFNFASTIKGFLVYGKPIKLTEVPRIDLIVTGSVAVDKYGGRLGKGGGYAELEYGILREIGAVNDKTPIATTVHDLQIVDRVPLEKHDLRVDIIATPTRLVHVNPPPPKPRGIYWELLSSDKWELEVIRELARLKGIRH
ncbi:MAG: 5-formyltetrahydrofolate cyclo-ligase [Thermoprotei archaeon]